MAVIGGSGLSAIEGLDDSRWVKVKSPFGEPSDAFLRGKLAGQPIIFLPRHGRGHTIGPSQINYRANIDALKRLGVTDIVSASAVGALKEEFRPGTFLVVDQFIDRTVARAGSFFGTGVVAHVSLARPVCGGLGTALATAAGDAGIEIVRRGTYVAIEGPQFSTVAESNLYRAWGGDVIGMTNMPEARLAREAEMCYATMAMVTDYDCWHPDHESVTVAAVLEVLRDNADKARAVIKLAAPRVSERESPCPEGCQTALDAALITAPKARDRHLVERLDAVAGRVLKS